jgi:hypothetical protein
LALATATFTWTNLAIVVIAGAVGGFAGAFASTLAAGGSVGQAFQAGLSGALWGGISAGLAFGIGHVVAPALSNAIGISKEIIAGVGHVAVGGALSEAQGGDFWSGALAAGAGVVAGMVSQKWITNTEMPGILGRTAIAAIAGGTAAELSGGKFANGAMTSAMQHLFNHEAGNIFNRGANLDPFESDGTAMWDSLAGKNQIGAVAKGLGAGAEALMVAAPAPKVGFLARLGSRIKQLFVAAKTPTGAADDAAKWIWGQNKGVAKSIRQMEQRGWNPQQVTEAIKGGQQFPAKNLVNPNNPAVRYVHPQTGQSVVQDTVTKEIIHFGGPGFKY